MVEDNGDIESLFKKMLIDYENWPQNDEIYQIDVKDFNVLKVQWKICGIEGYQIFDKDKISYKFGERLDEPDVTLTIRNKALAREFLKGEVFKFSFGAGYKGGFKLFKITGWKTVETERGKKRSKITKPFLTAHFNQEKKYHPFILSKMPVFRNYVKDALGADDYGVFIPINKSLGKYENQIIPIKVFKHFIDKASNIVMQNDCPCRRINDCKDHSKEYGCMYMGDDTINILITEDKGRVATKEEALERVRLAVENGLIPLLGRAMDEADAFGVNDTGHFLSMCFCCPCCCIDGKILTNATVAIDLFHRMEGVTVQVDENLCIGCEKCLEICVFRGMEIFDGKAKVNQDRCVGCGRCETVCPNDAVSIDITDLSCVEEQIKKLESHVQVS